MPTISISQALLDAAHTLTKHLQQIPTPLGLQILTQPTPIPDIHACRSEGGGGEQQLTNQSTKLGLDVTPHQP